MSDTPKVCAHGSLARKCELCERDEEIKRLERELAAVTAERDELAAKKAKLVSYNNQLAMWLAKAQQEKDKLTAERDDYAERWHELTVKQPDIDAVVARLRKTEAERDALWTALRYHCHRWRECCPDSGGMCCKEKVEDCSECAAGQGAAKPYPAPDCSQSESGRDA